MRKLIIIFGILSILIVCTNCNKLIFRDIKCRDFVLNEEYYWFPNNIGDTITFIHSNIEKKYKIAGKNIFHTTNYASDTGCGCVDGSDMLLTSNSDSLWFVNELRYIEDNQGIEYETVVFVWNNIKSVFYETDMTILQTFSVNNINFTDVKKFKNPDNIDKNKIKTVYLVKNIGIVEFEFSNGERWINKNLTEFNITKFESFKYKESQCN